MIPVEHDFRWSMALEVASQIEAVVLEESCEAVIHPNGLKCHFPLMEKKGQQIPFCWYCVTDKEVAHRGRTILHKAKLANQGIIIDQWPKRRDFFDVQETIRPTLRIIDAEGESSWLDGMPI